MPLTAQPAGQSYSNGCSRNASRKKKTSEQIDTAVMINVMLHPAVNIQPVLQLWGTVIDLSDAGKALWWTSRVFSLMYELLGENRDF